MRFGLTVPNFGDYFDPRLLATLARDAEHAGWDGFFVWDHTLAWPTPIVDPWVALSSIALATERIRIGPLVTPLPRRRPTKLAREVVSLDHLSNGRVIIGVGIGAGPWEWDYLGEETDLRTRGAMLDEGLELLAKLWSGEPVLHDGRFYSFRGDGGPDNPEVMPTPFLPTPLQRPRVPIWVAGTWPNRAPFRRAARWDGVVPIGRGPDVVNLLSPEQVREVVAFIAESRSSDEPFDVVVGGHTSTEGTSEDTATVQRYHDEGATWWLEDVSPWAFGWQWEGPWPVDRMNDRIRAGPPRLRNGDESRQTGTRRADAFEAMGSCLRTCFTVRGIVGGAVRHTASRVRQHTTGTRPAVRMGRLSPGVLCQHLRELAERVATACLSGDPAARRQAPDLQGRRRGPRTHRGQGRRDQARLGGACSPERLTPRRTFLTARHIAESSSGQERSSVIGGDIRWPGLSTRRPVM